jgi:hypothetical protein
MTAQDREVLIGRLLVLPELDYHAQRIIKGLCADEPTKLVDMLLARVQAAAAKTTWRYEAVPERKQDDCLAGLPASERTRGLVALGTLLRATDFQIQHAAQELFARLGGGAPRVQREVRLAWANSRDPELILCAGESFRGEPATALLAEEEVVASILRAAEAIGSELVRTVRSEFAALAASGVRIGTPGQPAPLDVQIRDQARAIAAKYGAGSIEASFYSSVADQTQDAIDWLLQRHEEDKLGHS